MAYIGFNPSQLAIAPFATKYFTGDGVTTTFTLDQSVPGASESNVEVFVENVQQSPIDAYTIGGSLNNQLIFSEAPVSGAAIYVIHKGEATYNLQPATGSVTAATLDPVLRNFTVDKFTGNGSTKTFTLSDTPYSPNSVLVMVDGIVQTSGTNYTVSGNTLTFDVAPTEAPDNTSNITVVHLGFSSGNKAVMDASITPLKLSPGGPTWSNTGLFAVLPSGATISPWTLNTVSSAIQIGTISSVIGTASISGVGTEILRNSYYDTGTSLWKYITAGAASRYAQSGGTHVWHTAPVGVAGNTATFNEVMRISIEGNVGIATVPRLQTTGVVAGNKSLTIFDSANGGGGLELMTASSTNTASVGRIVFGTSANNDGSRAIAWIDSLIQGTSVGNQGGMMRFATKAENGSTSTLMQLESNGVVTLPFGQIKFPAVQNASSDPNTLDDYEEGLWTPTLVDTIGGAASGYSNRYGQYVKIGSLVYVRFIIQLNNKGTLSGGEIQVTGIPFDFDGGGLVQQSGYLYTGWSGSFIKGSTAFYGSAGRFTEFVNNGFNMSGSNVTNTFYLWGAATYKAIS